MFCWSYMILSPTTLNAFCQLAHLNFWKEEKKKSSLILANKIVIRYDAVGAACGETSVICNLHS